ncbi:MAG: hypothetical protein IPH13_00330 [Planctomycetes bacterium]|nr:hypothetical protein [Planctomycetota bacterium]
MALRPQDVLVTVVVALAKDRSYPAIAGAAGLSLSEAHASVRHCIAAGLLRADRSPNRAGILEFLTHGVKYSFPAKRGRISRGMLTAHAAAPLRDLIDAGTDPPPVWPDPEGTDRGEALEPLYRSVPAVARRDPKLYEILCLVDAIRAGRARERALAEKLLRERIE